MENDSLHAVTATSDVLLLHTFGDPKNFNGFDENNLRDGDYAVIVSTKPGVIFFLRPKKKTTPETVFDGDVIMAHLLLGPNAEKGEVILRSLVQATYTPKFTPGEEMDGVLIPFWVLKKK